MQRPKVNSWAGEDILRRRRELGLSQKHLADLTVLSVRTIRDIERGRVVHPTAVSKEKLSAVLRLPLGGVVRDGVAEHIQVGILGSVALHREDQRINLPGLKTQSLLGVLALHNNQTVLDEDIVDWLWTNPPKHARRLLRMYASRLRALLEPDRRRCSRAKLIHHGDGGYRIDLAADKLDSAGFINARRNGRAASAAGRWDVALSFFSDALRLWRGPVVANLGPSVRLHPTVVHLTRARVAVAVEYAEIAMALNRPWLVSSRLWQMLPQEPYNEALHASVIRALAAEGDRATAMQLYGDIRVRMREELGVAPGRLLQQALRGVLDS